MYRLITAPTGVYGSAVYRDENSTAPRQFRPEITVKAVKNKSGSNVNVDVKLRRPYIVENVGVTSNPHTGWFSFSTNSLLGVNNIEDQTKAFDQFLEFLRKNRDILLAGEVPKQNFEYTVK